MYLIVTESMFRDTMNEDYPNSFSYDGLALLFSFLESVESSESGNEFESFYIYQNYSEVELAVFAKEHDLTYDGYDESGDEKLYNWEEMTGEMLREVIEKYLEDKTCVVGFTDTTVVYKDF